MREVHVEKYIGSFQLRWQIKHTCLPVHLAKSPINWVIKKMEIYIPTRVKRMRKINRKLESRWMIDY